MADESPIIGVLGGMGPAATADFYRKLVEATPADRDQDHLRTLIWSDPTIPDRATAYVHGGESPIPHLIAGAQLLERSGAGFIAVPCNTAHLFLAPVRAHLGIPVIDMIEATVDELADTRSGAAVAVLGTAATASSSIYHSPLAERGLTAFTPRPAEQLQVSEAILRVKRGEVPHAARLLAPVIDALMRRGAEAVIAACTELPLAMAFLERTAPLIDPTAALARACVRRARIDPRDQDSAERSARAGALMPVPAAPFARV